MVIPAEKEEARRRNLAGIPENPATVSPSRRSMPKSRLHNFSFPTLSWGNQKLLRCVNPSSRSMMDEDLQTAGRCSSSSSPNELLPPPPRFPVQKPSPEDSNPSEPSASRPWNLRSRRASRNAPTEIFSNRNPSPSRSSSQSQSPSHSPLPKEKTSSAVILVRGLEGMEVVEKGERRKFSIALSREEIEADFLAAKGTRPPRRPKKRPKCLQGQLDGLFPGVLLSEVTADLYKVEEIGS